MNTCQIFVTGASSGIGLATCRMLRDQGCRVFASARSDEDLSRLQREQFIPVKLDLESPKSCEDAVHKVMTMTGGKLWGLFNNAAHGQPGAVEDLSRDVLRHQLEVNLVAQHHLTSMILPDMRGNGGGRIVFDSSVLGIVHMPYRGAYTASKFALEGLAATLRIELAGSGIDVSVLRPGPITTNFKQRSLSMFMQNIAHLDSVHAQNYQKLVSRLDGNRPSRALPPEAVARAAVHALCSHNPRNYYRITANTWASELATRLLPSFVTDRLVRESF